MPHATADSSDFEKLQMAWRDVSTKFGSVENILEAFGLAGMPVAQRYGIMFGCLVFFITVASVLALLFLGGSFERIAEQTATGKATVETDYKTRLERPMLLERLLDARERLIEKNYPERPQRKERRTKLTKMLMGVPPPKDSMVAKIVDDNGAKTAVNSKGQRMEAMDGYKENFVVSYRKCQDKPGGKI
jgi:hypothetical protein